VRVELHPLAEAKLKEIEDELPGHGYKASRADIVNALIFGATTPQAHGMLPYFVRRAYAHDHPEPK